MAPKPDKSKEKAKAKIIEDKTFGVKNKSKSKAVQQYVKSIEHSLAPSQKEIRQMKLDPSAKDKKAMAEAKQKELNELFAVAIKQPKIPAGVDPKSVVCEFFRHNQCTKGFKCKYSHDLAVERKGPKIDLFTDQRDIHEGEEDMDDWDQETLERVIKEKHANEKPSNTTAIICKHFLDAVERKIYGWFWKCPSGAECKYRHALPAGYVLKSQMKELLEEEARNQKDMAEVIEEERAKVDGKTPITEEVFQEWHKKRMEIKRKRREDAVEERKKKGLLTGREIFMQEGFQAEDDANADDEYTRDDDDEKKIQEMLAKAAADAQAARDRAAQTSQEEEKQETGPSTTLQLAAGEAEELFDDDDEDDFDEDELEQLEQGIRGAHVGTGEDG